MEKERGKELLIPLGERLRELRLQKGFTLEELANEADIELSQVHRIEKGKINPKYTTLKILADALNMSLSDVVKGL
jgi:transcriptional regulator with XRE-family HTH domain